MGSGRDSEVKNVRVEIDWPEQFAYLGSYVQHDAKAEQIPGKMIDTSIVIDNIGIVGQGSRFAGVVVFDIPASAGPDVFGEHVISGMAFFQAINPGTGQWQDHKTEFSLVVNVVPGLRGPQSRYLNLDGTYTVQHGDTLWWIARSFGATVDAIASTNGITNTDLIWVGQVLKIPKR